MSETATPPPVHPSARPATGPKWPKIIGIICIILGCMDFISGLFQGLNIFLIGAQLSQIAEAGAVERETVDAFMKEYTVFQLINGAVLILLSLLVIAGGVVLLKRKRSSIGMLRAWSVLKIVTGVIVMVKGAGLMKRQMTLIMGGTSPGMSREEAEMVNTIVQTAGTFGMVIGILFMLALPVFLLVWFGRAKVREDIAAWG